MAEEYDDEAEDEAPAAKKPKRPRKPTDWPLLIMVVGTIVFLGIWLVVTLMAPSRPFLALRSAPGKAATTASTAGAGAATTPGAPATRTTPGATAAAGSSTPAATAAAKP